MSAPAHTPYPFWLTGHPHGRGGRAWLVLVASAARCRVECVNARSCTRQTRRTPGNTHAPHVWLAMRPALLLLTSHVVHLLCIRHHRQGSKRVGATLQLHTASHTCSRKARSRSLLSRPPYSGLSHVLSTPTNTIGVLAEDRRQECVSGRGAVDLLGRPALARTGKQQRQQQHQHRHQHEQQKHQQQHQQRDGNSCTRLRSARAATVSRPNGKYLDAGE